MSILNDNEQAQAAAAVEGGLVAEGVYACRITGVEKWKTGTSLLWKLRIEPGQEGAGRELYDWTGLTERGIWKTKERFEALGVELSAGEESFLGMPVAVTVEIGTNDQTGAAKNTVVSVVRGEGGLVAEAVEKLDAVEDSDIPF
jgi:hypothetical protein